MPSKASMISFKLSTACGFSILAITGMRRPSWSIILCTSFMSAALLTNESAIMSTPCFNAHRKSEMSFSESAGTLTATPGRFIPLLSLTVPASVTRVTTESELTSTTSKPTLPSSMRMRSPTLQSPGKPEYVVPQIVASPGTSRVVMVNGSPMCSSTGPEAKRAKRILGPCKSARIPTPLPVAFDAARTISYELA